MSEATINPDKQLDFMYNVMREKLNYANNAYNVLITKINILFALVGIILISYVAFLYDNHLLNNIPIWLYSLRIGGVLGLFAAIFFLLVANHPRKFIDPPKAETIYSEKAFELDEYSLKNKVVKKMKSAFLQNKDKHEEISKAIKYANWFIAGSILLICVSIMF